MKKQILSLLLLCSGLSAAEPDWPALERYAVDLLQRYVRIPSIDPPANTRAAAEFIRSEFQKRGIQATLYPSGPEGQTNLLVRIPGRDRSKKPILLLNHLDVVPVDPKAWTVDPFGAEILDGFLWGRGAMDMKGTGVQHMVALMALHDAGISPSRDVVMLSTADEENNGTYGIRWMIENHFPEIEAAYVLDEGGWGFRGVLSPDKLIFGIAVGEKQVLWLRLRAKGVAGHGSQPIPENANVILLQAIEHALALPPQSRPNPVVEEMLRTLGGQLAENKFTAAIRRNTVSLTTLTSGVGNPPKVNVIPSAAEATLDCRLLPGVNGEEFVSDMKARINDPRVSVETMSKPDDTGPSDSATPLFALMRKTLERQYPGAVVTPMLIPYGTDSAKLRKKGLTAYGFSPTMADAALIATLHSDAERIPIDSFLRGIRFFYEVLRSDYD